MDDLYGPDSSGGGSGIILHSFTNTIFTSLLLRHTVMDILYDHTESFAKDCSEAPRLFLFWVYEGIGNECLSSKSSWSLVSLEKHGFYEHMCWQIL